MYKWTAYYHLAVWISVALLFAFVSPQLFYYQVDSTPIFLAAVLTSMWLWNYWRYAEVEWGDFQPRSVALALAWPLLFGLAFISLEAAALFDMGVFQLAVVAAVIVSLAFVAYMAKNELPPITSGDVIGDLKAGTRTLPLALLLGLPLGWIFAALYEGFRMITYRARIAGAITIVSVLMSFLGPAPLSLGYLELQFGLVEVLAWPGIIAWEELVSRFMLPLVGLSANYMFVALHAPSRTAALLFLAPAVLAVISMATRWITDVFRERRSVVATISAHAVYNGMLGWLFGLFMWPTFMLITLAVLAYAYITRPRGQL